MDIIFTIVSRNYAAQAATLMRSVATHEPAARRVVVATDGAMPSLEGICEVVAAEALGAPLAAMSVYYDALELNTAVKPFVMRTLLTQAASVTYLDPDIELYAPLSAVRAGLADADIALTPHRATPLKGDGSPSQADLDRAGRFNLGFLAVRDTASARGLLDWWAERCRIDCRVDFDAGLFVDQKWMDEAPQRVERAAILSDPTLNVAYWNLDERTLDAPTFFHFSGFDPRTPRVLSKHQNRIAVKPGSRLAKILEAYAGKLMAAGYGETIGLPYAHNHFADGRTVTPLMRRTALAAARAGHDFDGLSAATSAWFDEAERPGVTRLMAQAAREHPAGMFDLDRPAGLAQWVLDNAEALGIDARSRAAVKVAGDPLARFDGDAEALLAWKLGPETLAGRFDPSGASAPRKVLERAAEMALIGPASVLKRRLFLAFGIGALWPTSLRRPLQSEWLLPWSRFPSPFVRLFEAIWESRADLRRLYPMDTRVSRLKYLRWLLGGGLAEYGVRELPPELSRHPLMRLAKWTVR